MKAARASTISATPSLLRRDCRFKSMPSPMYLNRHSCDAFCEAFKALKIQLSKQKKIEKMKKNEKQQTAGSRPKGVNT
jgi:hypothetical protein